MTLQFPCRKGRRASLSAVAMALLLAVPATGIAAPPDQSGKSPGARSASEAVKGAGNETRARKKPESGAGQEAPALQSAKRYRNHAEWTSDGRGDTLNLTPAEADAWYKRPVVTSNGELVGYVAAVRIDAAGKIEKIAIQPDDIAPDAGRISVEPKAFMAESGKIVLSMNSEEIRSHGRR